MPRCIGYAAPGPASDVPAQSRRLRDAGCIEVFTDPAAGGSGLARALTALQPGDTLVVDALPALGRSTSAVLRLLQELRSARHPLLVLVDRLRFGAGVSAGSGVEAGGAVDRLVDALRENERHEARRGMTDLLGRGVRPHLNTHDPGETCEDDEPEPWHLGPPYPTSTW